MAGTAHDMQSRLSAHEEQDTEHDSEPRIPGTRTDPVERIFASAVDASSAVDMMLAEGIAVDDGSTITYQLQRPLEPLPDRKDGSAQTDTLGDLVSALKFVKVPYGRHMRKCRQMSEIQLSGVTQNEVLFTWITAFSGVDHGLLGRIHGDDFRLCGLIAEVTFLGKHHSSTPTKKH